MNHSWYPLGLLGWSLLVPVTNFDKDRFLSGRTPNLYRSLSTSRLKESLTDVPPKSRWNIHIPKWPGTKCRLYAKIESHETLSNLHHQKIENLLFLIELYSGVNVAPAYGAWNEALPTVAACLQKPISNFYSQKSKDYLKN